MPKTDAWLGLIIGNTRLHWALFTRENLLGTWHTPHLTPLQVESLIEQSSAPIAWSRLKSVQEAAIALPAEFEKIMAQCSQLPICCASVVPAQTDLWDASYPDFQTVQLRDLPLDDTYPTLGIDRALNVVGAGDRYGWPVLVIDAGTALTLTTGDRGQFTGGAILPGLNTQLRSLSHGTATLPNLSVAADLPPRWATNTSDAIRSGVVYGLLATLQDFVQTWHREQPTGTVILTGGDAPYLQRWLARVHPHLRLCLDLDVAFWGLCRYRCG